MKELCFRVLTQIRMSHVPHMNESCPHTNELCHTYEWIMSHIWICHVTHMNESYHTYEQGLSHIWTNKCHTYEWVWPHIRMNHIAHMNKPWHTCKWVTSHTWMRVTWHRRMSLIKSSDIYHWTSVIKSNGRYDWMSVIKSYDSYHSGLSLISLRAVTTRNARACRITHSLLTHHSLITHSALTLHSLLTHSSVMIGHVLVMMQGKDVCSLWCKERGSKDT